MKCSKCLKPNIAPMSKMLIALKKARLILHFSTRRDPQLYFLPGPSSSFALNPHTICIRGQEVRDSATESDIWILCRQPQPSLQVLSQLLGLASERWNLDKLCKHLHKYSVQRWHRGTFLWHPQTCLFRILIWGSFNQAEHHCWILGIFFNTLSIPKLAASFTMFCSLNSLILL